MPKPICDLELTLAATQAIYGIRNNNQMTYNHPNPEINNSWKDASKIIADKGYEINHQDSIAPKYLGGTSDKPLSAICLKPIDKASDAPIIVAFKGTVPGVDDFSADLNIAIQGVAGKTYRDAAFDYYEKIRADNPGKQIILSGHSLAGNLVQYTGLKAYNQNKEPDHLLEIRAFNSAPTKTAHDKILSSPEGEKVRSHFVTYRTQHDLISKNIASWDDGKPQLPKKANVADNDKQQKGTYGLSITIANSDPSKGEAHKLTNLKSVLKESTLNPLSAPTFMNKHPSTYRLSNLR